MKRLSLTPPLYAKIFRIGNNKYDLKEKAEGYMAYPNEPLINMLSELPTDELSPFLNHHYATSEYKNHILYTSGTSII